MLSQTNAVAVHCCRSSSRDHKGVRRVQSFDSGSCHSRVRLTVTCGSVVSRCMVPPWWPVLLIQARAPRPPPSRTVADLQLRDPPDWHGPQAGNFQPAAARNRPCRESCSASRADLASRCQWSRWRKPAAHARVASAAEPRQGRPPRRGRCSRQPQRTTRSTASRVTHA